MVKLTSFGVFPTNDCDILASPTKKADVAEHPKIFDHVGFTR